MELEDLSITSLYHALDTEYNIKHAQQPTMPEPSLLKGLLYGVGRDDALQELNKFAHAKAVSHLHYNEIIFYPNIKPQYSARPDVRNFARDTVYYLLRDLGFVLDNSCGLGASQIPICVHIPLNVQKNVRLMRVFGPYMMFDKKYILTQSALLQKRSKMR